MSRKSYINVPQLSDIDRLIRALKVERNRLERLFSLIGKHRDFFDNLNTIYIELWSIRKDAGLDIMKISDDERRTLEMMFGPDNVIRQQKVIDLQLQQLIDSGKIIEFIEIKGALQAMDQIIQRLEDQKIEIAKRKIIARKKAIPSRIPRNKIRNLFKKVVHLCSGIALIWIDVQSNNLPTIIGGVIVIATTTLDNK